MDKVQLQQIEKARKIVKQYHFDGFPVISLDYAISRLKPIMDDIEGFEPTHYDLYDVDIHHQRDGSTAYKGTLRVTYLSVERELYTFRY
jgi:hypothetical protein|nr:MAG TPA_asm: hypothetical protein [Caudoviricetes sp.]